MKIFPKKPTVILALLICAGGAFAQQSAPAATDEQKISQMKQEIELLRQQQEIEKIKNEISNAQLREITGALPKNSSVKPPDAKTTFNEGKNPNIESIALSYEALRELSAQISTRMTRGTAAARFSGMVIYYEPDFLALGKYRLYRSQSKLALKNYELVAAKLAQLNKSGEPGEATTGGVRGGVNPLSAFLALPSIATSYAESVAELFAVFRTETVLTQSADTIDADALGVAVAGEFKKSNPNLRVYHPQSFVPEYDSDAEANDSLPAQAARVRAANFYLDEVLRQAEKIPEAARSSGSLGETLALVKAVKNQLQGLTISDAATRGDNEPAKTSMPEFRQLVRAEKLDRFLRGGQSNTRGANAPVGILKLRLLASGGTRRETRNLFLGNKIRYSGSAVLEIQLFDTDGNLQSSEIFSYHTGFRKMKAGGK